MEGVAGGELRGGRQLRVSLGVWLWWFPSGFEVLGGSAGSWGVEPWLWNDGGGFVCAERDRKAAAAVLAGDGEEDLPWSIDCYGGARWGGLRSPEVSERLGAP